MKYLLVVFTSLLISACGDKEKSPIELSQDVSGGYEYWARQEVCCDGVVYIDRYRHLSVKFLPNGKVATKTALGVTVLRQSRLLNF